MRKGSLGVKHFEYRVAIGLASIPRSLHHQKTGEFLMPMPLLLNHYITCEYHNPSQVLWLPFVLMPQLSSCIYLMWKYWDLVDEVNYFEWCFNHHGCAANSTDMISCGVEALLHISDNIMTMGQYLCPRVDGEAKHRLSSKNGLWNQYVLKCCLFFKNNYSNRYN